MDLLPQTNITSQCDTIVIHNSNNKILYSKNLQKKKA